jgi:Uma2 family endonuclease
MNVRFDPNDSAPLQRAQQIARSAPTEPAAFARWVATRPREEGRYELSHGVVEVMHPGTSRWHNNVCKNIVRELERQLNLDSYDVFSHDFALRTPVGIRYPDIVVEHKKPTNDYEVTEPLCVVEVLSPTSTARDFIDKAPEYMAITTLQTYLVCSQLEPIAWVWSRASGGSWPARPAMIEGRAAVIVLGGLTATLTMAAIYRDIPDG